MWPLRARSDEVLGRCAASEHKDAPGRWEMQVQNRGSKHGKEQSEFPRWESKEQARAALGEENTDGFICWSRGCWRIGKIELYIENKASGGKGRPILHHENLKFGDFRIQEEGVDIFFPIPPTKYT